MISAKNTLHLPIVLQVLHLYGDVSGRGPVLMQSMTMRLQGFYNSTVHRLLQQTIIAYIFVFVLH